MKSFIFQMTLALALASNLIADSPVDFSQFVGAGTGAFDQTLKYKATFDSQNRVELLKGMYQRSEIANEPNEFITVTYEFSVMKSFIGGTDNPYPGGYFLRVSKVDPSTCSVILIVRSNS